MVLAYKKKCCLCKHSEGLHKFMFPSNILIFNEWVRVAGVDLTLQDRNKAFLCSRNMPLISFFLLLYYHLAQNHLNNITIWIIYTVCNIVYLSNSTVKLNYDMNNLYCMSKKSWPILYSILLYQMEIAKVNQQIK